MASSVAVGAGPGIKEQTGCAQMEKAEALLERYLALGNDREEFFELTTPLFISEENTYSLMVPGYKVGPSLLSFLTVTFLLVIFLLACTYCYLLPTSRCS